MTVQISGVDGGGGRGEGGGGGGGAKYIIVSHECSTHGLRESDITIL